MMWAIATIATRTPQSLTGTTGICLPIRIISTTTIAITPMSPGGRTRITRMIRTQILVTAIPAAPRTATRFTLTHTQTTRRISTHIPTRTQTAFARVSTSTWICTLTCATPTSRMSTSTATRGESAPPAIPTRTVTQMPGSDGVEAMRLGPPIDETFVPRRACVEEFAQDGECLLYSAARDEASALNRTATEI